jgi:hypothetical protein
MGSTIEVILTIIGLSFWLLFPVGMFLSVSHIDKNTDQLIRLEELRHKPVDSQNAFENREEVYRPIPFDWHHPFHLFRQWLEH